MNYSSTAIRSYRHFQAEAAAPILNKVGQVAASPVLRNILGQTSPKFDLAYAMDNRRILIANVAPPDFGQRRVLIANLAKGQIGEQASNLLGSLLLSHLQLVAMARSDQAPENRAPFFVHIDEFQNSALTPSRHCYPKPASSKRISVSRTNISTKSALQCAPQCSGTPARS